MNVYSILEGYGFEFRRGGMWWGMGTLVAGRTAHVTRMGDKFRIQYHYWFWDGADYEVETSEELMLYPAEALTYLFTHLPLWR